MIIDDHAELKRLLADGCLIIGRVIPLSGITRKSIGITVNVFSIQTNSKILLDPANRDKSLIMLTHPSTGHRVEILTSDERTISRANEQRRYQEEPVGTLVTATCAAGGGPSSNLGISHLDYLVPSLDGLWGWKFTLGDDVGMFQAQMRLESTDRAAAAEAVNKLRLLLDCLAVNLQCAFRMKYYYFASIPRCEPFVSSVGPEERMLPSVTHEEIDGIKAALSSLKAVKAAAGLNEAYAENWPPSRLARLWAAAEDVFGSKPQRLLSEEEVECLVCAAEGIESLSKDSERLKKLKDTLTSPLQLPLENRNRNMAEAIAPIMGISVKEAHSKVSTASKLRGKHGHGISRDAEGMEASEKFLQEALRSYLAQQ